MEIIEQIKKELTDYLIYVLKCMYEYDHNDSMHSIYHGEVLATQNILAIITRMTTEVTKGGE